MVTHNKSYLYHFGLLSIERCKFINRVFLCNEQSVSLTETETFSCCTLKRRLERVRVIRLVSVRLCLDSSVSDWTRVSTNIFIVLVLYLVSVFLLSSETFGEDDVNIMDCFSMPL